MGLIAMTEVYGISGAGALRVLQDRWGFPADQAKRILDIARTHTYDAEPVSGGILHIRYRGNVSGRKGHRLYEIEADVMTPEEQARFDSQRKGLPPGRRKVYTQETAMPSRDSGKATSTKGREMPPRKSKTAPEPATATDNGDLSAQVEKALNKENFSATMNDYLDWFTENVTDPSELAEDLDRLMVMTLQFYGPFQRSDFNRERREARAAAKAPAEETEEPAKPTRGRGRASGKAPASNKAPAGKAPARRTRGRAPAASGATPY
jgi:hypothetical protein